jgi:enoyl-CoA hydratase/carnithine racemase
MSYASVRTERSGDVGLIVLSDAAPDVQAIVLAADGRHFCAGADYGFVKQLATAAPAPADSPTQKGSPE